MAEVKPRTRLTRWRTNRWGYRWIFGVRRGEWWIGARRDVHMQVIEINLLGVTLMIGRN